MQLRQDLQAAVAERDAAQALADEYEDARWVMLLRRWPIEVHQPRDLFVIHEPTGKMLAGFGIEPGSHTVLIQQWDPSEPDMVFYFPRTFTLPLKDPFNGQRHRVVHPEHTPLRVGRNLLLESDDRTSKIFVTIQ